MKRLLHFLTSEGAKPPLTPWWVYLTIQLAKMIILAYIVYKVDISL